MSNPLAPHLTYLRRYARALTGSQLRGDTLVRAALTSVVDGTRPLPHSGMPRIALYRLFHEVWLESPLRCRNAKTGDSAIARLPPPDARLAMLDRLERASLLLTAVESFSIEESAFILGLEKPVIERCILDAQKLIDRLLASRILIIEDEPIIALDLDNLVTELGHQVVAIASTRNEAIAKAQAERPGLVLADINLGAGGSGLEAATSILGSFDIPVIFITAYPEALLTGERPEPTYLIAKPFLPESVHATVSQALFFHANAQSMS
jgi:CheY-like chemotaxis protein